MADRRATLEAGYTGQGRGGTDNASVEQCVPIAQRFFLAVDLQAHESSGELVDAREAAGGELAELEAAEGLELDTVEVEPDDAGGVVRLDAVVHQSHQRPLSIMPCARLGAASAVERVRWCPVDPAS